MARSLATDTYTAAEVDALLRSPSVVVDARVELLDRSGNVIDDDLEVYAAQVEMNVDRPIKGAFTIEMAARPELLDAPFQYRLRPWVGFGPLHHSGVAWYPMGVYVWNAPQRSVRDVGLLANLERWRVTLGDQQHVLNASGPGLEGFNVARGTRVTNAIGAVLARNGIDDQSGIAPDDAVAQSSLSYTLTAGARRQRRRTDTEFAKAVDEWWRAWIENIFARKTVGQKQTVIKQLRASKPQRYIWEDAENQPETWTGILQDLHDVIGYYSGWFDHDGIYRAEPAVDLAEAPASIVYEASDRSTLLGQIEEDPDLDRIGNRVICRSDDPDWDGVGLADLNDFIPDHPLAERQVGFYVDAIISVPFAANDDHLWGLAVRELYDRLSAYATLSFESGPNPAHEAFDVVGVRVPGDLRFGDEAMLFHERAWTMNLLTGRMRHDLRRLLPIPRSEE